MFTPGQALSQHHVPGECLSALSRAESSPGVSGPMEKKHHAIKSVMQDGKIGEISKYFL